MKKGFVLIMVAVLILSTSAIAFAEDGAADMQVYWIGKTLNNPW